MISTGRRDAAGTAPPGAARTPRPCPAGRSTGPHGQLDLHHPARQDGPAVPVRHAHLPPATGGSRDDGAPADPGRLRLPAGGPRRAALRGAVRPVRPEPAPLPRFLPAILRGHRAATAAPHVHPLRDAGARCPAQTCGGCSRRPITRCGGRTPPLVRFDGDTAAGLGSSQRPPIWTPGYRGSPPVPGMTRWIPSATRMSRCTWPGSGTGSDAQAVLAGSKDAARCISYLTKYLTKQWPSFHPTAGAKQQQSHIDQLTEALRYEPCSPRCANWLRYSIQPKNARPGLHPGACKGKSHRREHLGYAGRRVLVSRKWSGKTLADHRSEPQELAPGHPRQDRHRARGRLRLGTRRTRRSPTAWNTPDSLPAHHHRPPHWHATLAEAKNERAATRARPQIFRQRERETGGALPALLSCGLRTRPRPWEVRRTKGV